MVIYSFFSFHMNPPDDLSSIYSELRTPLHGIICSTDLLMREPTRQEDYVGTIHQCSMALLKLVNDLLGR